LNILSSTSIFLINSCQFVAIPVKISDQAEAENSDNDGDESQEASRKTTSSKRKASSTTASEKVILVLKYIFDLNLCFSFSNLGTFSFGLHDRNMFFLITQIQEMIILVPQTQRTDF